MYLFYVDESGNPNGWNNQSNLVLGGIAVYEGQVHRLATEVDAIQKKFFPQIIVPIEFHAGHVFSRKGHFGSLDATQRQDLLKDIFALINNAGFPSLLAFASSIHISAVKDSRQALSAIFEDICQRFNTFLVQQHKAGHPQKGLLIIDRSTYTERHYLDLMSAYRASGTQWGYLGNVVDIPYFTDSHLTRLMQLADFVAWAVNRAVEYNDPSFLAMILDRFPRRVAGSPPDGRKHIVAPGHKCACPARH